MLYRAICSGITLHTANFSFSRGVRSRSSWTTREINTHKDNTEMNNGHTDTKTTAFAQMQQLPHNRFSPFFATVVSPAWTPKRGISVGLHCLHRPAVHPQLSIVGAYGHVYWVCWGEHHSNTDAKCTAVEINSKTYSGQQKTSQGLKLLSVCSLWMNWSGSLIKSFRWDHRVSI